MGKNAGGPSGIKAVLFRTFNTLLSKKWEAESKNTFLVRLKALSYDDDPGVRGAVTLNLVSRLNVITNKNEQGRFLEYIFTCHFNIIILQCVAKHKETPPWASARIISAIIPKSGSKEPGKNAKGGPIPCYSSQNIGTAFDLICHHAGRKETVKELKSINLELANEVIKRFSQKGNSPT